MAIDVRPARSDDAASCRDIYAPFVEDTWISFEEEVPSVREMMRRIDGYGSSHGRVVAGDRVKSWAMPMNRRIVCATPIVSRAMSPSMCRTPIADEASVGHFMKFCSSYWPTMMCMQPMPVSRSPMKRAKPCIRPSDSHQSVFIAKPDGNMGPGVMSAGGNRPFDVARNLSATLKPPQIITDKNYGIPWQAIVNSRISCTAKARRIRSVRHSFPN